MIDIDSQEYYLRTWRYRANVFKPTVTIGRDNIVMVEHMSFNNPRQLMELGKAKAALACAGVPCQDIEDHGDELVELFLAERGPTPIGKERLRSLREIKQYCDSHKIVLTNAQILTPELHNFDIHRIIHDYSRTRCSSPRSENDVRIAVVGCLMQKFETKTEIQFHPRGKTRKHADIWSINPSGVAAGEVKFSGSAARGVYHNTEYVIPGHSFRQQMRLFSRDIERIENDVLSTCDMGFAIIVSNNSSYWDLNNRRKLNKGTQPCKHDIVHGAVLHGLDLWPKEIDGSTQAYIQGHYKALWRDFVIVDYKDMEEKQSLQAHFRYCVVDTNEVILYLTQPGGIND